MNTLIENMPVCQDIGLEAYAVDKDDLEYLTRPMLDGWTVINEQGHIKVDSPHVGFAEARLSTPIENPLPLYCQVLKKAKAQGVKISYKGHYRKRIEKGWPAYKSDLVREKLLFQQIRNQVSIVEKRGIHCGTRDDAVLHKLIALCGEYNKFYNFDCIISEMHGIHNHLRSLLDFLDEDGASLITL